MASRQSFAPTFTGFNASDYSDSARLAEEEGRRNLARINAQNEERLRLPTQISEMADPYRAERDLLVRNPQAALESSPFFRFMQERAMNATKASNAAGGFSRSGRGLLALQDTAQKSAANFYFPLLQSYGRPETGAQAFLETEKYINPSEPRFASPSFRRPLASRVPSSPAALPYQYGTGSYGSGAFNPLPNPGYDTRTAPYGEESFNPLPPRTY